MSRYLRYKPTQVYFVVINGGYYLGPFATLGAAKGQLKRYRGSGLIMVGNFDLEVVND